MSLELLLVILVVFFFSLDSDTWTGKIITMSIMTTVIALAASHIL